MKWLQTSPENWAELLGIELEELVVRINNGTYPEMLILTREDGSWSIMYVDPESLDSTP